MIIVGTWRFAIEPAALNRGPRTIDGVRSQIERYVDGGKAFRFLVPRDHTTVMSAVRRVEALRQRDPQVNAHLEAIEQRLASSDE